MKYSLKRACRRHLTQTFGLNDYRPGQKEAAYALLSGRDVMCILPTGAGKSLCWQLPAVVHPGWTVIVSPLIALMHDQVQHLRAKGIPAISLDSMMSPEEKAAAMADVQSGRVKMLFVSPERLAQQGFRRLCQVFPPWLVVVDEAHCVVQWGEHFRPAYANIAGFLDVLPAKTVVCTLTATADDMMQRAISTSLKRKMKRIMLPIVRENLCYEVRTTLDGTSTLLLMMQSSSCKTVVFCRTRQRTEFLASLLAKEGVSAAAYHAGMEPAERNAIQQHFQNGMIQALCATTAFGMGVDIPDVRRVIHDHLPDNLIDYVQQSGRAGRDGEDAQCILLLEPNDLVRKTLLAKKGKERILRHPIRGCKEFCRDRKGVQQLLKAVLASTCIPAGIARSFGKRVPPCRRCSACRKGRLVANAPDVLRLSDWQIRAWILLWQRDAMANQLGVAAEKVLPDRAVAFAARRFVLPEEWDVHPEMDRLLAHFRRG